jgi:hydroxymethylpyrimidine/phosphomethylpyrimidine kinase
MKRIFKALTIAGSDSGAGAGIQADLKTFAALGVYGTSVITAVTAQNTRAVVRVLAMSPGMVARQIDAVIDDIGCTALKTGMLANAAIVKVVAAKIRQHRLANVVVDPVMVAKGGASLLNRAAVAAVKGRLIPLARVVTPNLPEAEWLTGVKGTSIAAMREAARRIIDMGAQSVVVKGGHRRGPALDVFYDGKRFLELVAPRVRTRNTHGTGCTFSAAVAAYLARGESVKAAVVYAKRYVTGTIRKGFAVGSGHGPVHHFYRFW